MAGWEEADSEDADSAVVEMDSGAHLVVAREVARELAREGGSAAEVLVTNPATQTAAADSGATGANWAVAVAPSTALGWPAVASAVAGNWAGFVE